jgi:hypothetical protein
LLYLYRPAAGGSHGFWFLDSPSPRDVGRLPGTPSEKVGLPSHSPVSCLTVVSPLTVST